MNYLANLHNSLRSVSAIPWRTADNKDRTFEAHTGGGQRSNHTLFVPLSDGKFQLYLSGAQGKPQWPQGCAYGVNYLIDYWLVEDE